MTYAEFQQYMARYGFTRALEVNTADYKED
ncbi:hypothetical protein EVB41_031 [Rhizobium phage RHph_TM3_14A]|nr:hypothetical protein EVB29_031 [Rhizobium phage RHph_TM27A]QIG66951.1 hypothetical protein EVB30_031 [Rhizobium phage RHph_TM27B]QIG67496.1 hypothetical protein EVB41_031 [Rhizobium phage RHph_TM3_14A]